MTCVPPPSGVASPHPNAAGPRDSTSVIALFGNGKAGSLEMDPDPQTERVAFIKSELARTSVPTEYEVARVLAEAGFRTRQGRAYLAAGRPREIDVLAEVPEDLLRDSGREPVRVYLVAEVKNTDKHPWLILCSRGDVSPLEVVASAVASTSARSSFTRMQRQEVAEVPWFFNVGPIPGHSLGVAGGKDLEAYEALSQVLSASLGIVDDHGSAEAGPPACSFAWSALVVTGELFTVDYLKPEPTIAPIPWGRIIWHGGPTGRPTAVDVVRLEALSDYAEKCFKALRGVRTRLDFDSRQTQTR